mgnify:CR=1 FL=1
MGLSLESIDLTEIREDVLPQDRPTDFGVSGAGPQRCYEHLNNQKFIAFESNMVIDNSACDKSATWQCFASSRPSMPMRSCQ